MNSETRHCQNCKKEFTIFPEDFELLKKLNAPPPTFCPSCRLQRRLTWRNERSLYKRNCDLCKKQIIAMYPADAPFPVYCRSCWFSDKWDGTLYGREYDFSKNFFEQFRELQRVVPRLALQVDNSINSDYSNHIANCKNCYLVASGSDNEDCMYGYRFLNSKNLIDCLIMFKCEQCYESMECRDSSQLMFSTDAANDLDLRFCYDVRGSQHCFMSSNLRQASHRFRNETLLREEYAERMKDIDTGSYTKLETYRKEYATLFKNSLHAFSARKNVVNSVGHVISNTKDCYYCFAATDSENCRYCLLVNNSKDTMDVQNGCCTMSLIYEVSAVGVNAYNIQFSSDIWPDVQNVFYSESCRNGVSDLFGCHSLRKKQYCILNKQYTKEEYETLASKIRAHMNEVPYTDARGNIYRYGEFFPAELSVFAYNETVAHDYFPLTREEVLQRGLRWNETEKKKNSHITLPVSKIPDHVRDIHEDILNEVIGCLHEGRCDHQCTVGFRIVADELRFYKTMNIALPRLCPNCRHHMRFGRRNPIAMWQRRCDCKSARNTIWNNNTLHFHGNAHCPNEFLTSYDPAKGEIVYCEACYQQEVA